MAGAATAETTDVLTSSEKVNGRTEHFSDHSINANHPYTAKSRISNDSTAPYSKPLQKHNNHPNAVNGISHSRNSSISGSKHGNINDQNYLAPNRLDALGRVDNNLSRTHSEADSLLDLYGRDSANRSVSSAVDLTDRKGDPKTPHDQEDPEEHWIHRDKLARIESEELQQFGFHVSRTSISSMSVSRKGRSSHDSHGNAINEVTEQTEQWPTVQEEDSEKLASPTPTKDVTQEASDENEFMMCDPRLPEEIAADAYGDGEGGGMYQMPGLRKSSSRIPVLATSNHPIPLEHLEREVPLTRTRNNTLNSGDDESISYKTRRPSESAVRTLETPEPIPDTTRQEESQQGNEHSQAPRPLSPQKSKTPSKATPASRKSSAPPTYRRTSGNQKSKSPSNSNNSTSNQRPGTRSGEDRPRTAVNRPEGDPPWLATMYKPDPRLPPDEQVIPTHAKKIQQQQWEREGKVPSAYDRDFGPIAIQNDRVPPTLPPAEPEKPKEAPVLKVPSPAASKSVEPTSRPGTSGTDRGYKTIPNVSTRPPSTTPNQAKPHPRPMAMEDPPDKEKGCGCCIVM